MATFPSTPGRIAVGECRKCGHVLRMKPHAVNPIVNLTCKCGAQNTITVPADILESHAVTAAKRDRQPAPFTPPPRVESPQDRLIRSAADRLLEIYRLQGGFLTTSNSPLEREIRQIGSALDAAGGFELMVMVHSEFQRRCEVPGGPRNLEFMWHGIGRWQG